MRDPRLIDLRLKCERDRKVSDGAFRLFSRLISDRYLDSNWRTEDEFTLPASLAQAWTGLTDEHDVYRRIKNLSDAGYMRQGAIRGCPPKRRYFLCPITGENPRNETGKKPRNDSGKKPRNDSGKKPHHEAGKKPHDHISNPFRKELSQRESNGAASAAKAGGEDDRGSLRSQHELAAQARKVAELLAALKRSTL